MVEGISPLLVLQGNENALLWCSRVFSHHRCFCLSSKYSPYLPLPPGRSCPSVFSCSVPLLAFLIPCPIFSISSPHLFCLRSILLLLKFPSFSPVSLSSSRFLLQLTCSSSLTSWIPVSRFIQIFPKYSMHFRYRCVLLGCFLALSMLPARGSRVIKSRREMSCFHFQCLPLTQTAGARTSNCWKTSQPVSLRCGTRSL